MRTKVLRYRWVWRLESSPAELWPLVSDTNRFNRDSRAPRVRQRGVGADGTRDLEVLAAGRTLAYEETPFEWVRPERFGVRRRYASGPLAELRALVSLSPVGRGTELVYEIDATPRGLLGRPIVARAVGTVARRRFDETFRRYDRIAAGRAAPSGSGQPALVARERPLGAAAAERLRRLTVEVGEASGAHGLAEILARLIAEGDERELARLRPYALADAHGVDRRAFLETCLQATTAGLLEARWEAICPHCRGAAATASGLGDVVAVARCESCAADVALDFERALELVFTPGGAIRPVEPASFCVGGPGVTPHVVARQLLDPGEERAVELALEPGRHRLRARGLTGTVPLDVAADGPREARIVAGPEGWEPGAARLATTGTLVLTARTPDPLLVDLARDAWSDQAASAADVTALQAFRSLFASESLRPGLSLGVASLTLVFTDLRGSTRLYQEIGDAPAFGSVAAHFAVLECAIAAHGGGVVKTIGDAVLAVFRRPAPAVEALLAAQAELARPAPGRPPLALKVGIHAGPCLAVTLNGRLDYFGSAVNAAARIVGLSDGDGAVISDAVRSDPEVAKLQDEGMLETSAIRAELRGLDGEYELWRVRLRG